MSEPGKNAEGLRGFPTPEDVTENDGYVLFRLPKENDWVGLLLGAAGALTKEYNFYQWGALTPAEAAEAWKDIVQCAPYNLLEPTIDAPFWDDDEDVDAELPSDAQPWYGTVSDPEAPPEELDFVENAAIFALTGFLAVATWEVGAAPAILFHTIAPKFVLAIKRGDVGEVIRILIDGQDAARVDTSSAAPGDIVRVPIVPADSAGHDIMIVQVS